jgi:hypothetical protein
MKQRAQILPPAARGRAGFSPPFTGRNAGVTVAQTFLSVPGGLKSALLLAAFAGLSFSLGAATDPSPGSTPPVVQRYAEIRRYSAPEARQGVCADASSFWAVNNSALARYRRADGVREAIWECEEGKPLTHLNAAFLFEGRLYCAHSNYPGVPNLSSVEIFDAQTLRPIGSHSFGHGYGSLTWIDRREGAWFACFVFYPQKGAEPNRDPSWSELIKFDAEWRRITAWVFPADLVKRFDRYSCSGGAFGPDGRIYVTGHDATELYVLEFPIAGSTLRWMETIPISAEGQAFAWDPSERGILWTILKRTREVIVGRVTL